MTRTVLLLSAAAALALTPLAPSGDAEAHHGTRSYQWTYDTKRRQRGYEGYIGVGPFSIYCSYYRVPRRRCTYSRSGRERCRTKGWRLVQRCG